MNQSELEANTRQAQETRAGKSRLVLVLLLISRGSGERFSPAITNRSDAKPKQLRNYFRHSIKKRSNEEQK